MLSPLTGFACSIPWRHHLPLSRLRDRSDVERTIESLAREPNSGLILPNDTFVENPSVRKFIVGLTAVFVQVSDPLGQGIVESLARPTGNITGFSNSEFSLIGKYLQILREIAPSTTRVAVMIHTSNAVSANWFRMFNTVAPSFAIEPIAAPVRDQSDVERTIESLARG